MFEITFQLHKEIPCLVLKGRLDGFGAEIFEKETRDLHAESSCWLVDFKNVDYMSSAGIRALLRKEKELRKKSGKLVLFSIDAEVEKIFTLTGLEKHFTITENKDNALAHIGKLQEVEGHKTTFSDHGNTYNCTGSIEAISIIDLWNSARKSSTAHLKKDSLIQTNMKELGISFGLGGFGNSPEQAQEGLGLLVSLETAAGIAPADGYCRPDFIFTETPVELQMFVAQALSFSGEPSVLINHEGQDAVQYSEMLQSFARFFESKLENVPSIWGFVTLADVHELHTSKIKTQHDLSAMEFTPDDQTTDKKVLIVGIYYNFENLSAASDLESLLKDNQLISSSSQIFANAFVLDNVLEVNAQNIQDLVMRISRTEHILDVVHFDPKTEISRAKSWIFLPSALRSAEEKQLTIETTEGTSYNPEWDTIIRRIYADCGKVVLDQLHGGFTSMAFRVTGYDKDGRRLLPTVLKIGSIKNNDNEVNAYHKYVKKFILNNSTTIMGTTTYKNWGGLRYNFLGINGSDSTLVWLTDYYKKYPAEKLIPLFDRIFTDILKPWYGQPRWEHIYPYIEHSPLLLFPNLFECLERELGISADTKTLYCNELGREIINPFNFLKYEYPARKNQSKLWYVAVTHGDLNMQNILLDEKENIYIIDFSETKPRNIVSDFARLEPIFKIEMCSIDTEQELEKMLEFEQGILQANTLSDVPEFTYRGADPMVKKAYSMICKLREYADTVTIFEHDITPYLFALLEWTFSVVCYSQTSKIKKKYALYSAALMCEKINELNGMHS